LADRERFTHISGHPLAVGRVQDMESSPFRDQRSIPLCQTTKARYFRHLYLVSLLMI